MMTGVFRQVERDREGGREGEREKGARFEFRIETGVSVLARVIVPRTVLFGYNECMEGEAGMIQKWITTILHEREEF